MKAKEKYNTNREVRLEQVKQYRENNKDKIKEYRQKYNEENKEYQKAYRAEYKEKNREQLNATIYCNCGSHYTLVSKSKHFKTQRHQNYLKQLEQEPEPEN